MKCFCDFPATCGGMVIVYCGGCGGDICVCRCGGESECGGCSDCRDLDEDWEPGLDEEQLQ